VETTLSKAMTNQLTRVTLTDLEVDFQLLKVCLSMHLMVDLKGTLLEISCLKTVKVVKTRIIVLNSNPVLK
jgi:hypothetical protein